MILKKIFKIIYHQLENYKNWFINRFFQKNIPDEIDLVVSSIGGAATTCLLEFLSKYLKTNDIYDADNLKHARHYKLSGSQKIIFIIVEPKMAYQSLKRRKYLYENCKKLGLISYFIRIQSIFNKEINFLQKNMKMLSKKYPNKYLSIEFDELFNSAQIIKDFSGLKDDEFIKTFPQRRKRITDMIY